MVKLLDGTLSVNTQTSTWTQNKPVTGFFVKKLGDRNTEETRNVDNILH